MDRTDRAPAASARPGMEPAGSGRAAGPATEKLYRGAVIGAARVCSVMVVDGVVAYPLNPRFDLRNASPTGFNWGYGGSGPAQLALALLADALGDDDRALRIYQAFKFRYVGGLPQGEEWELPARDAIMIAESLEQELEERGR